MTARFQLVIDCADPEPLARFWVAALGYEFEPPPDGYDNWDDYWRAVGVSEDEFGLGLDRIVDPAGGSPRIWFQVVPEKKTLKNRLHPCFRQAVTWRDRSGLPRGLRSIPQARPASEAVEPPDPRGDRRVELHGEDERDAQVGAEH